MKRDQQEKKGKKLEQTIQPRKKNATAVAKEGYPYSLPSPLASDLLESGVPLQAHLQLREQQTSTLVGEHSRNLIQHQQIGQDSSSFSRAHLLPNMSSTSALTTANPWGLTLSNSLLESSTSAASLRRMQLANNAANNGGTTGGSSVTMEGQLGSSLGSVNAYMMDEQRLQQLAMPGLDISSLSAGYMHGLPQIGPEVRGHQQPGFFSSHPRNLSSLQHNHPDLDALIAWRRREQMLSMNLLSTQQLLPLQQGNLRFGGQGNVGLRSTSSLGDQFSRFDGMSNVELRNRLLGIGMQLQSTGTSMASDTAERPSGSVLTQTSASATRSSTNAHLRTKFRTNGLGTSALRDDAFPVSHSPGNTQGSIEKFLPVPEGPKDTRPWFQRLCVPFSSDEDPNWLSEFLCFVRSDLLEVFRAGEEDVRSRNSSKKVVCGQVGIRCRYCAHLPSSRRATRSSSYPFTISRIYQSLTMMIRDHFGACEQVPPSVKERFFKLKGKTSQGATGSNTYWEESAKKLGLVDSEQGIWLSSTTTKPHSSDCAGDDGPPQEDKSGNANPTTLLVLEEDRRLISTYLFALINNVQLIHMDDSERIGNRKNLQSGLPGIGCRHCCQNGRKGLCRLFPSRRRTLPAKIHDMYDHIRRCTLCPSEMRQELVRLKNGSDMGGSNSTQRMLSGEREFFDKVWVRMGHDKGAEVL